MTHRISLDRVLQRIRESDDLEITQIIQSVMDRYQIVYPDWEVSFLALSRDPAERKLQLNSIMQYLDSTDTP